MHIAIVAFRNGLRHSGIALESRNLQSAGILRRVPPHLGVPQDLAIEQNIAARSCDHYSSVGPTSFRLESAHERLTRPGRGRLPDRRLPLGRLRLY